MLIPSLRKGISIHAPARGATECQTPRNWTTAHFNPRSRKGSDGTDGMRIRGYGYFNPRSRKGSDDVTCNTCPRTAYFNPRSRKGSDVLKLYFNRYHDLNFNPRSRKGSDPDLAVMRMETESISIHAPARGATETDENGFMNIPISIHAPARGATLQQFLALRRRCISIHAPARGATTGLLAGINHTRNFNPRSRKGSDGKYTEELPDTEISIHAPARGATQKLRRREKPGAFQSTLPQGERQQKYPIFNLFRYSCFSTNN